MIRFSSNNETAISRHASSLMDDGFEIHSVTRTAEGRITYRMKRAQERANPPCVDCDGLGGERSIVDPMRWYECLRCGGEGTE